MRGRFITFEGGEGTGKSTHASILADRLRSFGIQTKLTREPGGSPGAEIMRYILLSGAARPLGANAEAVLFAAARDDHLTTLIRPALEQGKWVVCDRFADSTRIYQGVAGDVDPLTIRAMERIVVGRYQARSHLHPRCAGQGRYAPCRQAPRRRGRRPVRGRGVGISRTAARRFSDARGERARSLRADRCHHLEGRGRRPNLARGAEETRSRRRADPIRRTKPFEPGGRQRRWRDPASAHDKRAVRSCRSRTDAARRLPRRPHPARLADRRRERHRQGNARLPHGAVRAGLSRSGDACRAEGHNRSPFRRIIRPRGASPGRRTATSWCWSGSSTKRPASCSR